MVGMETLISGRKGVGVKADVAVRVPVAVWLGYTGVNVSVEVATSEVGVRGVNAACCVAWMMTANVCATDVLMALGSTTAGTPGSTHAITTNKRTKTGKEVL